MFGIDLAGGTVRNGKDVGTLQRVSVSVATSGDSEIIPGESGRRIVVHAGVLKLASDGLLQVKASGGAELMRALFTTAERIMNLDYSPLGWFVLPAGEGLTLNQPNDEANALTGSLVYVSWPTR